MAIQEPQTTTQLSTERKIRYLRARVHYLHERIAREPPEKSVDAFRHEIEAIEWAMSRISYLEGENQALREMRESRASGERVFWAVQQGVVATGFAVMMCSIFLPLPQDPPFVFMQAVLLGAALSVLGNRGVGVNDAVTIAVTVGCILLGMAGLAQVPLFGMGTGLLVSDLAHAIRKLHRQRAPVSMTNVARSYLGLAVAADPPNVEAGVISVSPPLPTKSVLTRPKPR